MESLSYKLYPSKKKPLIMLHGFCESNKIWDSLAQGLSEDYDIICPNLPGFGDTPLNIQPYTIDNLAEELNTLLLKLDIEQCILIGHSMGGYVSLAFAEKYPEKLSGLGLFHSTAYADSEAKQETRIKAASFIRENGTEKFASSLFPSLFSSENKDELGDTIKQLVKEAGILPNENAALAMEAMRNRPDRTEVISNIKIPILYIIGKEDNTIPTEQSIKECLLAKDSTLVALDNAGHMGMLEAPETATKRIKEFLNYCHNS